MRTWLTVLALALGCGGGKTKPTQTPAPAPATEAQCREMADHMLDVQIASRSEADRPSAESEAEIRQNIRADFVPSCVTEVLQPTYECWMAATTVAALEGCAGAEAAPPPEGAGPDPMTPGNDADPGDPPP